MYADVVCPWCYIGKRRLETALKDYDGPVTVRFRPFQLDPATPRDGRPLMEWLAPRFGGEQNAHRMTQNTRGIAAVDGLELNFDTAIIANTFDAHRLIWHAGREHGPELMEALHRAHFADGLDIASHRVLADVAAGAVGLDHDEVLAFLASDAGVAEVNEELDFARDLGITSVPTFIFASKYAMSGAAEPANLLDVLDEVRRRESATSDA